MAFAEDSEFVCISHWDEMLYHKALAWVDEKKRVAILSSRERQSADPRVEIICIDSPLQEGMIARKIAWSAVFKKLQVIGEGAFKEELEHCHLAAHGILSESAHYWIDAMQNARLNDGPYRSGLDLQGAFSNIPAIIVGAGPSLKRNELWLNEFRTRGLIFAAGSALNSLDVEPHFLASIDARAPYQQFKANPFFETPFFYHARMNPLNCSLIHSEKILFPDNAVPAIRWMYGQKPFDGGWTVGNFLTHAAIHLGCSPIILVGMDFCYEGTRKYAKLDSGGVGAQPNLVKVGNQWTQKDWIMAARWTENMARSHRMINVSGGILRLPKVEMGGLLPLFPVIGDLRKKVHEEIQKIPLKGKGRWEEWDASLKRCQKKIGAKEPVVQYLLEPLWQIFRPLFEREMKNQKMSLHKNIFFQKIIEEHVAFTLPERPVVRRNRR